MPYIEGAGDLKELITPHLTQFAEWIEREGYRALGYNIWSTTKWSKWGEPMYETTEQLVKKFLKNR